MMPFMTQPAVAPACYVPSNKVAQSQLFKGGQYLSRALGAGNRTKWALAFDVQLGGPVDFPLLGVGVNQQIYIRADGRIQVRSNNGGAELVSTARYRDYGGWLSGIVYWDSAQSQPQDRLRVMIGGQMLSAWDQDQRDNIAQGASSHINGADTHYIGLYSGSYGHGLVARLMLFDGVHPAWGDLWEANIHGVWVPRPAAEIHTTITASGGWGVNGCHLDFALPLDSGHDMSGQGNHWTATGFDAAGKDSVASTPTNVYATLNPLTNSTPVLSEGDLHYDVGTGYWGVVSSLMVPVGAGRYRMQMEHIGALTGSSCEVGVVQLQPKLATNGWLGGGNEAVNCVSWVYGGSGYVRTAINGVVVNTAAVGGVGNGTIVDVYLDTEANTVTFRRDNAPVGTFPLPNPTNGPWLFCVSHHNAEGAQRVNFGQRPWAFSGDPSYRALCTDNLPEPDIKDPGEAFAQVVTTGANMEGALNALTGHWDSAPYMEIVKRRDASEDWRVRLSDDPTNAWATNNANAKASTPALAAAGNYVGYRLRVGARYGVWTAEVDHVNGTATTVSHGLNTARAVVIATRVSAGGGDRFVWHPDLPNGQLLKLNSIAGAAADSSLGAFGVNSFQLAAALPSGTYRVLVLAERVGFLSLSKHIGNGILNGPMVPMDILPLFSITKRCTNIPSNANGWQVHDAARDSGNGLVTRLWVNIPDSDHPTVAQVDFVVGGLKWRDYAIDVNASGETFINIAIGRPIGGVCVAPATAR